MTRVIRHLATILPLFLLGACVSEAALQSGAPSEILDENTGATITAVERPLIFARERRDLAANARDYVTLAAASVNRGGKIHYMLVSYIWSTVDTRGRELAASDGVLVISADDRRVRLRPSGRTAAQQGISLPIHEPPGPSLAPVVYETDLETLGFLAAARNVSVQVGGDELAPAYLAWDDERASLGQFVRFLKGER